MAAVLAVLLTVSIPQFSRTAQSLRAEQIAFNLTQLLRYAHERSVTRHEKIGWVWDRAQRSAHLERIGDDGQGIPLADAHAQSLTLPEAMTVQLLRDNVPVDRVRFFPDGTSESSTLLVSHRERVYTVTVDGTTSQVVLANE